MIESARGRQETARVPRRQWMRWAALLPPAAMLQMTFVRSARAETKVGEADQAFVHDAAQIAMLEVRNGHIVRQRATTAVVRSLAEQMVADHSRDLDDLGRIATRLGLEVPRTLEPRYAEQVEQIGRLEGDAVDRQYTQAEVRLHEAAIPRFRRYADRADAPEPLRDFARASADRMARHLDRARKAVEAWPTGKPPPDLPDRSPRLPGPRPPEGRL